VQASIASVGLAFGRKERRKSCPTPVFRCTARWNPIDEAVKSEGAWGALAGYSRARVMTVDHTLVAHRVDSVRESERALTPSSAAGGRWWRRTAFSPPITVSVVGRIATIVSKQPRQPPAISGDDAVCDPERPGECLGGGRQPPNERQLSQEGHKDVASAGPPAALIDEVPRRVALVHRHVVQQERALGRRDRRDVD
jgi:hypothetical protein